MRRLPTWDKSEPRSFKGAMGRTASSYQSHVYEPLGAPVAIATCPLSEDLNVRSGSQADVRRCWLSPEADMRDALYTLRRSRPDARCKWVTFAKYSIGSADLSSLPAVVEADPARHRSW